MSILQFHSQKIEQFLNSATSKRQRKMYRSLLDKARNQERSSTAEFLNLDAAIKVVYAEKVSRYGLSRIRELVNKINDVLLEIQTALSSLGYTSASFELSPSGHMVNWVLKNPQTEDFIGIAFGWENIRVARSGDYTLRYSYGTPPKKVAKKIKKHIENGMRFNAYPY